ncbi:hypothetical protein PALB_34070 [Pseudoalteromonas luteoviolacea B = ATCC 29581]|nr:hypothetical protein PALB_34070 [Pseudoalteromonas luteoviolacea B = ATCC 29581]
MTAIWGHYLENSSGSGVHCCMLGASSFAYCVVLDRQK